MTTKAKKAIDTRIAECEMNLARFDCNTGTDTELTRLATQHQILVKQRDVLAAHENREDAERIRLGIPADDTPEQREFQNIYQQVEVRDYLHAAVNGGLDRLTGPAAELREICFGKSTSSVNYIPLEVLLDVEERAATSLAATQRNQSNIGARVFGRSDSAYLGVATPTVAVGEASFEYLTAGVAPGFADEGVNVDQTPATLSSVTLTPHRLGAEYLFSLETANRVRDVENVLTADLRSALQDKRDSFVINGNAADPDIDGMIDNLPNPTNPTTVVTAASARSAFWSAVDSKLAYRDNVPGPSVRMLVNDATIKVLADLEIGTNSGIYFTDRYGDGVLRSSARMPDTAATIATYLVHRPAATGRAVSPVWRGVEVIVDRQSRARSGETTVTAYLLTSFDLVRSDGHIRGEFKLS